MNLKNEKKWKNGKIKINKERKNYKKILKEWTNEWDKERKKKERKNKEKSLNE